MIPLPNAHPDAIDPTVIAVAGDWHGAKHWADIAVTEAARCGAQAIVHTGDFGIWPGTGGSRFIAHLEATLARHGLTVFAVRGNHEDHDALDAWPITDGVCQISEHIVFLPHGTRWTWAGQRWAGIGGAVSIDRNHREPHRTWWPQEALSPREVDDLCQGEQIDVLVCHDAPEGIDALDDFLRRNGVSLTPEIEWDAREHRRHLARIVSALEPTHLFHGHYHHYYRDPASLRTGRGPVQVWGLDRDGARRVRHNIPVLHLPLPG